MDWQNCCATSPVFAASSDDDEEFLSFLLKLASWLIRTRLSQRTGPTPGWGAVITKQCKVADALCDITGTFRRSTATGKK